MSPDALSLSEPNVLPAGWAWAELGRLGSWIGGGTPSKSVGAYWANGSIPWVSPKDMKAEIIHDTEDHITEAAVVSSAAKFVPAGSVLMVMRSGILRHTFPVATNAGRVTVNQDLRALIPAADIDPRYIAYYLHGIQRQVLDKCSKDGTTVQSIEVSALERVGVPIAPTAEQRRIVARIDELFAETAEGEAALERARRGLDTCRRALLKAAVSGELTRDWREANHPVEAGGDLLARIRTTREASHVRGRPAAPEPLDTSSLPELPEGWVWACLGEIIESLRNGTATVPIKRQTECSILRISAVRPMAVDDSDVRYLDENSTHGLGEFRTQSGDLLFTRYNGSRHLVGVCGIFRGEKPVYYPDKIIRVRLLPQLQEITSFFEAAINSGATRKFIDGEIKTTAGQHGISGASLKRVPVPIPPITEAKRILESLQDDLSRPEDMEALQATDLKAVAALRQSILKTAFEGRLVPHDPTDEPASVLLARMRNGYPNNRARRRRARAVVEDSSYPSLPGLIRPPGDQRV